MTQHVAAGVLSTVPSKHDLTDCGLHVVRHAHPPCIVSTQDPHDCKHIVNLIKLVCCRRAGEVH